MHDISVFVAKQLSQYKSLALHETNNSSLFLFQVKSSYATTGPAVPVSVCILLKIPYTCISLYQVFAQRGIPSHYCPCLMPSLICSQQETHGELFLVAATRAEYVSVCA